MRVPVLFALLAAISACADDDLGPDSDDIEAPEDDGKADAATELSVRAADTTFTVNRALERRGDQWVLRGKTSRNILEVRGFVEDDVYGQPEQKSPRVFEMSWSIGEARTLVDGVNLFTGLTFVHSSTRPDHLTGRAVVRPRLGATSGSSTLALTLELTPVVEAGMTVYRVKGRSTKAIASLRPTIGESRLVDPTHFEIDLDFDQLMSASELAVTATFASGTSTIKAPIGLAVKKLGLTKADPYEQYPRPTCTAARESCLRALLDGALGTAGCGEAIEVRACQGIVGVVVDQGAVDAAKTASDAKLVTLGMDAIGLVGAARANDLQTATREVIAGRLANLAGAWLLTPSARTSVLARATDVPLDDAYAFPLAFVDGLEPAPGDQAQSRQVAADAILAYLRVQDYEHSEFGRSYLELTQEYRAVHVESLKNFREQSELITFASMPNIEYYVGDWLGAHTEVMIDKTTGEATSVLVELD
jgi:hypothetical protein